ncbi:phosphotransferase family protein [Streptomyces sp. NPDC054808]
MTGRSTDTQIGLDTARLGPWFAAEIPGAGDRLEATLITGGKSNLTFEVTDGATKWIVRRPPLGHVLDTAHNMDREYRVMSALRDTPVPVPRTYAQCHDTSVIGAGFYVMERCPGTPYRQAAQLAELGPQRTRAISAQLVDTLAALHSLDPVAVGLGDFGRPEGFLHRQVGRWKKQLDASRTRDLPAAEELHSRLAADIPTQSATAIVHGDYRLDNVLVDDQDRTTAVLDWEMATVGDPITDLALMILYGRLGQLLPQADAADVATAPGFLAEEEILARYATASDRDLSRFGWYLALSAFKLAVILEGIHSRHLAGQTVGDGFADIGKAVHPLLDAGLNALSR